MPPWYSWSVSEPLSSLSLQSGLASFFCFRHQPGLFLATSRGRGRERGWHNPLWMGGWEGVEEEENAWAPWGWVPNLHIHRNSCVHKRMLSREAPEQINGEHFKWMHWTSIRAYWWEVTWVTVIWWPCQDLRFLTAWRKCGISRDLILVSIHRCLL